MDIIRFEESFDRRQNAVERRKAGQFYTHRSTRIKLCAVGKRNVQVKTDRKMEQKRKIERKSKKTDKSIKRPAYLRPLKVSKKKKDGSKSERFHKRSEERKNKLQCQTHFEADTF